MTGVERHPTGSHAGQCEPSISISAPLKPQTLSIDLPFPLEINVSSESELLEFNRYPSQMHERFGGLRLVYHLNRAHNLSSRLFENQVT